MKMQHWTDIKVVLGYIANETKRFHLFVANRVGFIHFHSDKGITFLVRKTWRILL